MLLKKPVHQFETFTKLSENGGFAGYALPTYIHAARAPMEVSPMATAVKLGQTLLEPEIT